MSLKAIKRKRDNSEERPKRLKMGNSKTKAKVQTKKETKADIEYDEHIGDDEVDMKELRYSASSKKEANNYEHQWQDHVLLSQWNNLNETVAKNLINLFEEGNTIPFIARYRKNITGNMSVENLKDARDKYEEINTIKDKAKIVIKSLEKQGQLNEKLQNIILSATSTEEIDYIYAPYKPENKKTLAARAIGLGLEDVAVGLMRNEYVDLQSKVKPDIEGLEDVAAVEKSIMHIVSHFIATDTEVLTFIRKMKSETNFPIEAKKSTTKSDAAKKKQTKENKIVDETKFENYFEFRSTSKNIKHHQVLALNRGEAQKVLSVKLIVPEFILHKLKQFCYEKWLKLHKFNELRKRLIENAVLDSYTRLIQPLIIREVRSELKLNAEKASIEVFVQNLRQLLLMPPVKGVPILGIDPGFSNGCKIALISHTGTILKTDVLYPHSNKDAKKSSSSAKLRLMLLEHNCSLIAIGNGKACRETECWISDMIAAKSFRPLDVRYTIVNESGASIYSCSTEASKEFPDLDPNIISAVSLARRVQEPLAELVKVEPKHLGIGMYQHDLTKKRLDSALDEVVSECVSFVGVDLNTTSQCLLRRVAGLTDKKASDIIAYRAKNGYFKSREEILKVNRIGKRIYQQCAGFLRVGPKYKDEAFDFYKTPGTNKLDCTVVHPESYKLVEKLLKKLKLKSIDIGTEEFIRHFKERIGPFSSEMLCKELKAEDETFKLIVDSLTKPLNYDFRCDMSQTPIFKKGLTSITDLKAGTILTGRVENCTHFGCFVDIGVGCNGLLHTSNFKGMSFQIGDQVEVKVVNVDAARKRIGLEGVRKLK